MHEKDMAEGLKVESLILRARAGDQTAFEDLLKNYDVLFQNLMNRFQVSLDEKEDVYQELSLVFYNAVLSYDLEQKEVTFGLYSKICMQNALITQQNRAKRKNDMVSQIEYVGEDIEKLDDGVLDPSSETVSRETLENMYKKIDRALSPFESIVWQMYLTESGNKSIAKALGKSEKSIENAIFRIKRKLRDVFSENV